MFFLENVPLRSYSTMRLGGTASYCVEITAKNEISEAVAWAEEHQKPIIMVGGGSNILWRDEGFDGLLLVNKIKGFDEFKEDEENSYITCGAGEIWDEIVARTTELGLSGIEQLSLIPGSVGATPIQNVGAYGREISDVLTLVEAYDIHERKLVTIPASECNFSYRTSRFRTTDRNRFLITSVTLHLMHSNPTPPFYDSLRQYFSEQGITEFTPKVVRDAVIQIRTAKLPDPAKVANNGSFFYNPIIERDHLNRLLLDYPTMVYWPQEDGKIKVSAAWLLETAGFRAYKDSATGMATWPTQPLVLVNEAAHSTADVLTFRDKIAQKIYELFTITLQQEPELLP